MLELESREQQAVRKGRRMEDGKRKNKLAPQTWAGALRPTDRNLCQLLIASDLDRRQGGPSLWRKTHLYGTGFRKAEGGCRGIWTSCMLICHFRKSTFRKYTKWLLFYFCPLNLQQTLSRPRLIGNKSIKILGNVV